MDPSRVDRILEEWEAVAGAARQPSAPPRGVVVRGGGSSSTLAGAGLVAVAVVIAALWFGRPGPGPSGIVGSSPSASVDPDGTPAITPVATPATTPSTNPTPTPTPTAVPTIAPCKPANLPARITLWEGAAGQRIANVELTNAGSDACTLRAMARPQLVDGNGSVLIDGSAPPTSGLLTVGPGEVLKTLVEDGNYCGPAPVAPVSVAFVLSDGGRIVAAPLSPTDTTVPPCLGAPGSAGTIAMHPWAP